jgi:hypothetical protein
VISKIEDVTAWREALAKVAAAHGIDLSQAGEPEISITEVHRVVH